MKEGNNFNKPNLSEEDERKIKEMKSNRFGKFLKTAGIFGLGASAGVGGVTAEKIFADGNKESKVYKMDTTDSNNEEQVAGYMKERSYIEDHETLMAMLKQGEHIFNMEGVLYAEDKDFSSNLPENLPVPANYVSVRANENLYNTGDAKFGGWNKEPTLFEKILSAHTPFTKDDAYGLAEKLAKEKKDGSSIIFKEGNNLYRLFIWVDNSHIRIYSLDDITPDLKLSGDIYFAK